MQIAFIMDPPHGIQPKTDTTFAFMEAAQKQGISPVYVRPQDISLHHNHVHLTGHKVHIQRSSSHTPIRVDAPITALAEDFAAIFIRTDPPFDEAYLTATWLLSFAENSPVQFVNRPSGIRSANEKLYTLAFPDLTPATLISSQASEIQAFVAAQGGMAIGKPVDGHGGYGVVKLALGDTNFSALIDMLTAEAKQPIVVQKYLPQASQGDKRLLLIDGELKGAVRRVPAVGDHRGNVHVGGKVEACELDADDRRIAAAMQDKLKQDGLFFVGLDVIEGQLIEVNVTSPTLIQELRDLGGPDLALEIIERIAQKAAS